ncbi:MAG: globin domain-containing protein [Prosthecobacter sp.]|nr:globin domain-containing protein [Prosthecobacter sp.]
MITAAQKTLVQTTWAQVVPIADTAAELFYNRLFEMDPTLRPLFTSDIKEQGKKLMLMIGVAVKGLDRLEEIVPAVQALGKRHVGYGVKDEHYDTVAGALLWTLEKGLGEAYTPEVAEAWTVTYTLLADVMKAASKEAPAA